MASSWYWQGKVVLPGYRKGTSSAGTCLAISEPVQSIRYVCLGATKLVKKPGVGFRIRVLEPGARRTFKNAAPGAKI